MILPKVSIVIPVYNGANYLSDAIASALAQTYKNIEILVVNDGSNDAGETERIALSYGEKIRYFYKPNGGVASALNFAISKMHGEYFSWLSHDDLYVSNKIEIQVNFLKNQLDKNVVVYSDYSVFNKLPEENFSVCMPGVSPDKFRYWITVENKLHGCTLLIPRTAFSRVGIFRLELKTTQDYDMWFRMAAEYSFVHLPEVLVRSRIHDDQGSHRMADIALRECNDLLVNFVVNLNPQEIVCATGKSLSDSYRDISLSMFDRGFYKAGYVSKKLSLISVGNEKYFLNILDLRSNILKFLRQKFCFIQFNRLWYNFMNFFRKFFSKIINNGSENYLREKFSEVYEKNLFGGRVSRSGEGSDLVQTSIVRSELPKLIEKFKISSFLDAPCGDWCWMQETELGVDKYIGVDIVDSLINKNKLLFSDEKTDFLCLNLAFDRLPKVDMIFSRDLLVHLSLSDALKTIFNFKRSGAKYLLATTFVERMENFELAGKNNFWRPLNMQIAPFNFPEPLFLINEECLEEGGVFRDKSLGLWLLDDINIGDFEN